MNVRFKLRGARFDSEGGWRYDGRDYWLTDDEILKFEIFHGKKRKIPTIIFFLIPLSWLVEILLLPSITFLPFASFFLGVVAIYLASHYLVASEREALDRLSPEERLSRAVRMPWSDVSAKLAPVRIRGLIPSYANWYLLTLRPLRESFPVESLTGKHSKSRVARINVPEESLELLESFLRSTISDRFEDTIPPANAESPMPWRGERWKPYTEELAKYLVSNPKELDKVFASYDESGLDGVVSYLKEADSTLTGVEADRVAIEIIRDRDKLAEKKKEERWTVFSSST